MQNKENLLLTLRQRRINNFKSQFKSVILEGYEIFGEAIVEDVIKECRDIYYDYLHLEPAKDVPEKDKTLSDILKERFPNE